MYIEGRNCLESLVESQRDARALDIQRIEGKQDAGIADIRGTLRRLESTFITSLSNDESRQKELHDLGTRDHDMQRLLRDQHALWDSKFSALEPRVESNALNLQLLREELKNGVAKLRTHIEEMESSLRSVSIRQDGLKDECARRVLTTQELRSVKEELQREFRAAQVELERSISDRQMASAEAASQQMNELVGVIKLDNERGLHEAHDAIEQLRVGLLSEQDTRLKSIEESLRSQCFFQIRDRCSDERTNARKTQEEHLRLLEVERDARLRQATELRSDFVKAITKEREERILDSSEQRGDLAKAARELHTIKGISGGPFSTSNVQSSDTSSLGSSTLPSGAYLGGLLAGK